MRQIAIALAALLALTIAADASGRRGSRRTGGWDHGRGSHYVGGSSGFYRPYGRGYYARGLDSWGPRHRCRSC